MNGSNSEKQTAEIAAMLAVINSLYHCALRRLEQKNRWAISEALSEIFWKAEHMRFREAIALLRHARRMFQMVAEAESPDEAMESFDIRISEAPTWRAVEVSGSRLRNAGLPAGSMVLVPVNRRRQQLALAA